MIRRVAIARPSIVPNSPRSLAIESERGHIVAKMRGADPIVNGKFPPGSGAGQDGRERIYKVPRMGTSA